MRKRRTAEHREAICVAREWLCHICGFPVDPVRDRYELDHIIPLANGGTDDDDNLCPAHSKCHLAKTAKDVEKIAKAKRQRAQHLKTKVPTRNPLPGSKRSGWKQKLSGEWVRRDAE